MLHVRQCVCICCGRTGLSKACLPTACWSAVQLVASGVHSAACHLSEVLQDGTGLLGGRLQRLTPTQLFVILI